MSEDLRAKKERLLKAAEKGVDELINVLESSIGSIEGDLAADKMKNAAAAKRLAFEDALAILKGIEEERIKIEEGPVPEVILGASGFAEGRSKKQNGRR